MKVGDRIKIRTEDGQKWWGRITATEVWTEPMDVTKGGLFPGGPPPDRHRVYVAGRNSRTLTVEIEGLRGKPVVLPHRHRASCHGPAGELTCGQIEGPR